MNEKKVINNEDVLKEKELNIEALKDVSGGSLRNGNFTKTKDVSEDTKDRI